jgi:diguanylate cyclase (GGDEF)-like protein
MGKGSLIPKQLSATPILSHASGFVVVFFLSMWLRVVPLQSDPILQGYLQVTTGLLAFVFAAVTLVRFQGTQDRISLILGSGFLLSGTLLTASSLLFFQFLQEAPIHLRWAPVSWWVGRIVLGLLLVVALLVEHFLPRSRRPRLEIAGALFAVVVMTWGITALLRRFPAETSPHPLAFIPDLSQLLPAALFLVALVWFRRRLQMEDSAFDRALYSAAWMNVAAQLAASQSSRLLDSPFVLAQALTVTSYAVALGGALLDNARLFEQVQHLAVSDPLTGLANYRRLLDVLESETERTNRNNRPFAVLLLDLDGLKKINDTYGHLTGSRALCRLADTLRIHCRAIDTAARYGGDEFALILPESGEPEAQQVAARIREVLARDAETPKLSASIGISTYNGNGERIEKLLAEADEHLYAEKSQRSKTPSAAPTAALNIRRRAQKA